MTSSLPSRQIERIPTLRRLHLLQSVEDPYDGVRDEGVSGSLEKFPVTGGIHLGGAVFSGSILAV
jgi:hypothetical protein